MSTFEQTETETEVETAALPGERLRLAREALKLSQQDVAGQIRISVDKVAALESDEIARVGPPVFAAGYIRAYARIVGLPADELIPQFTGLVHLSTHSAMRLPAADAGGLARPSSGPPMAFTRGNGRRWGRLLGMIGLVLLILIIVTVVLWMVKSGNLLLVEAPQERVAYQPLPQKPVLEQPMLEQPVLEQPSPQQALPEPSRETSQKKDIAAGGLVLAIPDLDVPESLLVPAVIDEGLLDAQPVSSADQQAGSEDTVVIDSENELSLYFQADSWVEVHDARGERLIHQLARAGQTHALHGEAPFAVVLGYVPGVSLLLDGEAVDLAKYQGRRLARFSVGGEKANEN
ncbi:MAG: DUF4115 domain-containing protein [Gammaproteobacteria bacterium]|nr:DUF4115 domain-containing protein [Gammaproteobacteria bacterium]MCF6363358.1 DUF4115 domain-containing protein [Gammaproteobacteria bacterium]